PPFSTRQRADHDAIPRYVERLRAAAGAEGAAFLDLQPLFPPEAEAELYQSDRVHLSAAGHARVAAAVAETLAALDGARLAGGGPPPDFARETPAGGAPRDLAPATPAGDAREAAR